MDIEVKRGGVYWVSFEDDIAGAEMRTGRPVLVLSGTNKNAQSDTVICAYISSSGYAGPSRPRVYVNGKQNFVCCDQIRTISKERIQKFEWILNDADMERINGAIAVSFCLPTPKVATDNVVESNDTEVQKLRVELDIMKGMYENVRDQLVLARVAADVKKHIEEAKEEPAPKALPKKIEPPKVEATADPKVEINTCTETDLRNIGCSAVVAHSIVSNRPYKSVDDLRYVPYVTSMGYKILKLKVECVPVITAKAETPEPKPKVEEPVAGKVNVNVASAKEIREVLGCAENAAYSITGYRNKNGKYANIDDLLNVKIISQGFIDKHRDKIAL